MALSMINYKFKFKMLHEILLALLGHTGSILMQVVKTLDDI